MSQRLAAMIALLGIAVLVIGALVTGGNLGLADSGPSRISFQIATGSTEGVYFPVGQAMAGLISHPAGVGRCDTATVCGPAGVILSARTSNGAADNLRSVNQGLVDSGFADGDVIAAAMTGQGAFRRTGRARHLRVIAALFSEDEHLVVAANSKIHSVTDLRGQRVLMGVPNSGAIYRARAILDAYRVRVREVVSDTVPGELLHGGKIDAYFMVSGVPVDSVKDQIAHHQVRLVPIDGEGRERLIKAVPQLAPSIISAGAYPGTNAIETVSTRAFWVTRDSEPDALIYGLTRALFHPANRMALGESHPSAREIAPDHAAENPPAPIHSGAARFYKETGKLPS